MHRGNIPRCTLIFPKKTDDTPDCLIVGAGPAGLTETGDVVLGLDQISHAIRQGGVAATAIRNDLASHRSLYR